MENCLHSVKLFINNIVETVGADSYQIYLTGKGNYREKLYVDYKAHRTQPKPKHYQAITEYLLKYKGAEIVEGMEADDAMGIAQYNSTEKSTIICSIDKDMNCIPGWHYRWAIVRKGVEVSKARTYWVNELDAYRHFCTQCLTGDRGDNIPGLYKITGTKAKKQYKDILNKCKTIEGMRNWVEHLYKGHEKELELIQNLLWILREPLSISDAREPIK